MSKGITKALRCHVQGRQLRQSLNLGKNLDLVFFYCALASRLPISSWLQ
jgi:hypothetical protein